MSSLFTLFVKDLQSRTLCLAVSAGDTLADVHQQLQERLRLPVAEQHLIPLRDGDGESTLSELGLGPNSSLQLSGRLRGGKGGFGSLLRGSRKASQTNNEDACRDLSGRRIRIVAAEKKLQEWDAGQTARAAEKQAAREEKERAKVERRKELAQVDTEDINKERKAALARMERALQCSVGSGSKRASLPATKKGAKKPRIASDSEEDSDIDEPVKDMPDLSPQKPAPSLSGTLEDSTHRTVQSVGI